MSTKINIRSLSHQDLETALKEAGHPRYRADQLYEWLWKKSELSFDNMSNLSLPFRKWLDEKFVVHHLEIGEEQISEDGTIKCAFKLWDSKVVEGVLIPTSKRMTACISSQVGCSLTCKFCATGQLKRSRNLDQDEIYDQVVSIKKLADRIYQMPLTNIVYMGMGEPLLNYKNTLLSVEKIASDKGLNMSPKRITVSTAGIAKQIVQLGDDNIKFNLALSLHAANDAKRNRIMPINESNNLEELKKALNYYYAKTKNRITFEYIIFKNFNDDLQDAKELVEFCKKIPSKVNVIEYNPIDKGNFTQAEPVKVEAFAAFLEKNGVFVRVRKSRGKDIDAACGQLANKNKISI